MIMPSCFYSLKPEAIAWKIFKVHLTPNFFFAEIIRLLLWSNLAQKFFDLVKSSNFYVPSKPSFRWFVTAQGESGES